MTFLEGALTKIQFLALIIPLEMISGMKVEITSLKIK